jgi:hypothetical protein
VSVVSGGRTGLGSAVRVLTGGSCRQARIG